MSINEIYSGLPHELESELKEIETVLLNVQNTFPQIAREQAQKRFAYEIARARETEAIEYAPIPEGKKKPTVDAIKAMVDLRIQDEMEASRNATAELEIAKVVFDSVKTRLTSIQTRARLTKAEMEFTRN